MNLGRYMGRVNILYNTLSNKVLVQMTKYKTGSPDTIRI